MFNSMSVPYTMNVAPVGTASGCGNGLFDGNNAWLIIILLVLFGGWGGNRGGFGFGGGSGSGAADNYVLASDFATIQRQLSDGFNAQERRTDAIINGFCDLGYTQQSLNNATNMAMMQGFNATQSQLANCCCDVREGISGVNYNMSTSANSLARQISDCCCSTERQIERGFADTNYNLATQNCNTLQAIDKVGDRIIDYLANEKAQALRDENFTLKLKASQEQQNNFLVDRLGYQCPKPAYVVQPPQSVTFPSCGCNGNGSFTGFGNGYAYGTTIA